MVYPKYLRQPHAVNLGSPLPPYQDWARPCHIRTVTERTPATFQPMLSCGHRRCMEDGWTDTGRPDIPPVPEAYPDIPPVPEAYRWTREYSGTVAPRGGDERT